jgi:hypothetical protein
MTSTKYIGLDVHKESISIAVMNSAGKLVMESVIETKASTILQFIHALSGDLQVTFEEGTCAAWLYDLLKPHVTEVLVCNPRKNALLKEGSKGDQIDARKLAELLRLNHLQPVYHGEHGLRTLIPATRCLAALTPTGAAGSVGRKQEAQGVETAPPDTRNRSDPWGAVDGVDPDASPVSNQASAVDLQWSGIRNA